MCPAPRASPRRSSRSRPGAACRSTSSPSRRRRRRWPSCRPSPPTAAAATSRSPRRRSTWPRPTTSRCPRWCSAITAAVQHGFAQPTDFNTAPTALLPYGPQSEFQVTSPIVGTVNLKNSVSITGATLPNTDITNPTSGAEIPQRGNVMITAGFAMPGFDGRLRAFRMYKPVVDVTKPSGYKFSQDGTALWLAKTPMADHCNDASASCRNIFTVLPNGTTVAFNDGQRRGAVALHEHVGRQRPDQLRPPPAARRHRELHAGDHGSAIAGSAAGRGLPGLCRRQQGAADADLRRRQRRDDPRHRRPHGRRGVGVHPVQPAAQAAHACATARASTASTTSSTRRPRSPTSSSAASGRRWSCSARAAAARSTRPSTRRSTAWARPCRRTRTTCRRCCRTSTARAESRSCGRSRDTRCST